MFVRSLLTLSIGWLAVGSAFGGLVSQKSPSSDRPSGIDQASPENAAQPASGKLEDEKVLLGRLLAELQRSARSFIYLRSVGFTQSDEEFERIITANTAMFRRVRIVRRDERGQRQIPGWPGMAVKPEFKK